MKYLNALLQGSEKVSHPRGEEPAKPSKPVLQVLQGAQGRDSKKICLALEVTPPAGNRDFLSRPACQVDTLSVWEAWSPFMDWLSTSHPDRFTAICEAEAALSQLERQGITEGPEYTAACRELVRRFEAGRMLRFRETVKVWMQ